MYAVIETGGKQYRVQPGDILQIEKLAGDKGASVNFDQVLFASKQGEGESKVWIGKPTLSGAVVGAEILATGRGEKHVIVKRKRRKDYKRTIGHRQELLEILVLSVSNGAGEKVELSSAEKAKRLEGRFTTLAPKGLAFTPKTLGSRKRAAGSTSAKAEGGEKKAAAPKKAPAKKAAAKTAKKED